MKKVEFKVTAATLVAAVTVLSGMSSCKGRTMENMEPTGDTVEVTVNKIPTPDAPLLPEGTGIEESSESFEVSPEDRIPPAPVPDRR